MRIPFSHHIAVSLAFVVAKWFEPPAVVAVILTFTLTVALRQTERLKSWRQSWIVAIVLGSGLTIALAFLIAVQWMTRSAYSDLHVRPLPERRMSLEHGVAAANPSATLWIPDVRQLRIS
jgi:hypothetical protein